MLRCPPVLRTLTRRLPRWVLGEQATRAEWRLWLVLFGVSLVLFLWLREMRPPWKTTWAQEVANGDRHTFKTYLRVGLWWGTLLHLLLLSSLLLTGRWWARGQALTLPTGLGLGSNWKRPGFLVALVLLVAAAGMVRWPKMSQSYWGDEGWAVAPYVYGKHVPVEEGQEQGALVHKPVSWAQTAFDDRTCGNHYLFSLCQRATLEVWRWSRGLSAEAFDETISRLPPFIAGLGSLPLLALMLAWLGRPGAGLAAALMLALHPWHVRYSTEARGYTLMLFFLILAVWLALIAIKSGRWRWWLAFGAAEFLCMYSWKGVMYPLAAANAVLLFWVLTGKVNGPPLPAFSAERRATAARWLVSNVIAAGLFINLTYPCVLQIKDAKAHLIQLSGRPMGRVWLHNSFSAVFTGLSWHVEEKDNPTEVVLSKELHQHPWRTGLELGVLGGLLLLGGVSLASRHRWQAGLWLSMLVAGAVGAACFRWIIGAEWILWYFFFMTLPLAIFAGFGLDTIRQRLVEAFGGWRSARLAAVPLSLPPCAAFADLTLPQVQLMREQAYENHRGAFEVTRGRHEPLHHKDPSKVHTIYLWRYISLYDPRGDTHVRDSNALRERIRQVEAEKGELYVVIGHRRMARAYNPDFLAMVEDPRLFQPLTTFWAPEELHCLHCYHYLPGSLDQIQDVMQLGKVSPPKSR